VDTIVEDSMTRILIADPDSPSRKALSLLLTRKLGDINIYEAGDTETLIRTLEDYPLDILLLDWRLYGAPAPETCRLIQKAYPALKIVLLSVNAEDSCAAQESGAGFIHKGSSPETAVVVLEQILNMI
jgi:DNA-binding NarL/FixJ family response regulator